jgi:hypothetical protein
VLTYDTGALIAAEASDRPLWVLHEAALRRGLLPTVPTVVLAQAWRGGPRQAQLARLLRGCTLDPLTAEQAKAAGIGCARSGVHDIVDVTVLTTAAARGDTIVTSDPQDLQTIAAALGIAIDLHRI